MRRFITASLLALSAGVPAFGPGDTPPVSSGCRGPVSAESTAALRSTDELRRAGPAGLATLLEEQTRHPGSVADEVIDAVAGQKDARWSKLYWYTDLEAAKAKAKEEHRPILYLRMLGKLTDEYSCANSRFFRTVLYANEGISKLLREKFVLVWGSERPVPVITIEYGDGRVLKRTITGNSAHYVLDADGAVVDVLPGLYDPAAFARILTAAADAAALTTIESRRAYWQQSQATLASEWGRDTSAPAAAAASVVPAKPTAIDAMPRAISKTGVERPLIRAVVPPTPAAAAAPKDGGDEGAPPVPNAAQAGEQALGKRAVEAPMLKRISRDFAELIDTRDADDATWQEVAGRHLGDAHLDACSVALIRSQNPLAYADAANLARVVERFERSIAADTVRNNYLFRAEILGWLRASPAPISLEVLNERIYRELFLTPRSDPWLGLVPESTYTALSGDGCIVH